MRTIQTPLILIFILLAGLHSVRGPGPSRKNELNLSKVAAEPIMFWPIQSSKHNLPTTKRLAYLHDIPLTSGPSINAGMLDALDFLGGSQSFTFIPNNGTMNGEQAMCWMFFVYIPTSAWPQSSTLLAYEGTNDLPGFVLGLSSAGRLTAQFYDMDGTYFDITSSISLVPSEWQFIGINFNMLWKDDQFDFFLIDHRNTPYSVTKDTHALSDSDTLRLNAHGSIILGANHMDERHFVGKLACIQYYDTSIIGSTQKEAVDLCDPQMWSDTDYGEYTIDVNLKTTAQPNTTTTQPNTTTQPPPQPSPPTTTTTQPPLTTTTQPTTPTTTRQPITSIQTTTQIVPTACATDEICHCAENQMSEEELADKIASLKETLLVNKETTSMMIRTKTCADDTRVSARVIGQCGSLILIILIGLLVLQDIITVIRRLISWWRNIFHVAD